jgi:RHS repeat-associated protein/uncharacterized repeat protein (TIGR01451 family)
VSRRSPLARGFLVLLVAALLVVTTAGPAARVVSAAGGGGNASINLTKTIAGVSVTPALGLALSVDRATAIPGDQLTYTATLTNTGANLKLSGTFVAQNSSVTATIAADYDEVEYFSVQQNVWVPLAGTAASLSGYTPVEPSPISSGLTLSATGRPTGGVTFPTGADHIVGTVIGGSKTATWDYVATITVGPSQLALLQDPARVSKIRNVVHFEVTPRAQSVGQPFTFRVDFISELRQGNGTATNATITITPPSGAPAVFNPTTTPALASIPSGSSRTVQSTYVVPVVTPKGASETDTAYIARLQTVNGRTLTALADASATGGGGTIIAPQQTATTTEQLPILAIDKTGPATVDAGTTSAYDLGLANNGTATASGLVITDALPAGATGSVSGVPATIPPAGTATAHAAYDVPVTQAEGPLTDTASVTWKDANGNAYGPVSDSFTTQVQNTLRGAHLVLAPATAGPLVVGSTHTLKATLTDRNGAVVAGQVVHFVVTGPNATSGNATTDASGVATFTYPGVAAGTDQAQATATKNSSTVQSNTAAATWIAPIQPVSITSVHGNFFANTGVSHFTATPASTPVFGQDFPTIDFNPPTGTVLNNISSVGPLTRPFTDLTTDVNGNFTGSIVAEGNGHQAGVADLTHFDAEFTGSFVVTQASDVTFNVFSDAGFILGVGGGATRVNGAFENPPVSGTTPFQAYPVVGAYNLDSAPAAHPVTIHFPAPGSYPFEIDYFECCDSSLSLTLTTVSFIGDNSPLSIYVGYADGLRPGGSVFPFPWKGAPGVTFIGDNGTYDAGALRFDNSSDAPIVLDSAIVDIAGVRFDVWGRNLTVPAHGTLITTQTVQYDFDTSDARGATCTPIGTIPHVRVTIAGVTTTFDDTNQILNTRDVDLAVCPGGPNESHAWERIGGGGTPVNHALPPAATLAIDPNTASATVGLGQSFTITAMDASGKPVADLAINIQVFGVNTRTLTASTDASGIATVSYIGTSSGKDQVQARAFVTGMLAISDVSTITWANPPAPGGGGTPSPFPPPSIGSVTPADGATATGPVAIQATISPPAGETITDWTVSYERVGTTGSTVLASGTGTPPATLATFDPTLVANGTYTISITADSSNGGFQTSTTSLIVDGRLKLGRYTATYVDLSVAVAGLPIQVQRTYDSTDDSVGDFGAGWRVDLANFRVSSGRPLGAGGWTQYNKQCVFGLCVTGFTSSVPHTVIVTWPNGRQEAFDFTPDGGSNIFWTGTARFTPRPHTTSTLAVVGDSDVSYIGDGNLYAGFLGSSTLFDPQRFQLTAKDGTVYILDRTSGLVSATDLNGNVITVDATGIHSSAGPSIVLTRDAAHGGRITRIAGPADGIGGANQHLDYGYDAAGRLGAVTDPAGNTVTYAYDPVSGNFAGSKDPAGQPMQTVTYGPDGRIATIANGSQPPTAINTDIAAKQQTVLDPNGSLSTIYSFDDAGNVAEKDQVFGGRTLVTTYQYDDVGRVTDTVDPAAHHQHWVYDESATSRNGNLLSFTDGSGYTITYASYDSHGHAQTVLAPDGSTLVTLSYDPATGRLLSTGRPGTPASTFTYFANGRRQTATDALGRTTTFGYDAAGYLTSTSDSLGRAMTYGRDASGRLTSVRDQLNSTTTYTYDGLDNLTSILDPNHVLRTFHYNGRGLLDSMNDGQRTTTYEYNELNLVSKRTDRDGGVTTFTYDPDGRLAGETRPGSDISSYRYDSLERLIEAHNGSGQVTFAYDDAGNLTRQVSCAPQPGGASCPASTAASAMPTVTLDYTWNANGQEASVHGPDGTTGYGYDTAGRLSRVTDAASRPFAYAYDPQSRLSTIGTPNGTTDTFTYDSSGLLTGRDMTLGGSSVNRADYVLDPVTGQRTSLVDSDGTHTFAYLDDGSLSSATQPAAAGLPNESMTYDPSGNRTSWTGAPAASVSYDSTGRLATAGNRSFAYDGEGDLTTVTDNPTGNQTTYHWNADHQLTRIDRLGASAITFRYDPLGRRIEVNDGGTIRRFAWDGFNVHGDYDGSNALLAAYTTTPTRAAPADARQPAEALEVTAGGASHFYVHDGLGSTVAMTDSAGAVTSRLRYGAFGQPAVGNGSETRYTYAGAQFDAGSGLYYMRDRYYDPVLGRFLSEDPPAMQAFNPPLGRWTHPNPAVDLTQPAGVNRYLYAGDPIDYWDPSGDSFRSGLCALACAITVLVGASGAANGTPYEDLLGKATECIEQVVEDWKDREEAELLMEELAAADSEAIPAEIIGGLGETFEVIEVVEIEIIEVEFIL